MKSKLSMTSAVAAAASLFFVGAGPARIGAVPIEQLKIEPRLCRPPEFTFEEPTGAVTALVFSADGKLLAASGSDKCIFIFDVGTGKLIRRVGTQEQGAGPLAFSPDGTRLVSGEERAMARVWDVITGKLLTEVKNKDWHPGKSLLDQIGFSDDGKQIITSDFTGQIDIWDWAAGSLSSSHRPHPQQRMRGWVEPGAKHYLLFNSPKLEIYNTADDSLAASTDLAGPSSFAFVRADGKTMSIDLPADPADESSPLVVRRWDYTADKTEKIELGLYGVLNLSNPAGTQMAMTARNGPIALVGLATKDLSACLTGPARNVTQLAYSPDGRHLAAICGPHVDINGDPPSDFKIYLWAVNDAPAPH